MTQDLYRLCAVDELDDGDIKPADLPDGHRVAIYKVDGDFYVSDDRCSHGDASLSEEGSLDGCEVECSWHFGRFDVRTGQAVASPCTEAIRIYQVTVVDGAVCVSLGQVVPIVASNA